MTSTFIDLKIPHRAGVIALLRGASRWASAAAIGLGCLVLAGWLLDIPFLKSGLPGLTPMKANAALGFLLSGLALWWLQPRAGASRWATWAARACAGAAAVIGLLTLSQYVVGWDLGIDQLLFSDPTAAALSPFPGRMVPATAVSFVLAGIALLTIQPGRGRWLGELAALLTSLISLLAIMGLIYGAGDFSGLYQVGLYNGIALHTILGFFVLSLGILCLRPEQGLMAVFARDTPGGTMTRRLLPAVLIVPLVIGLVLFAGQQAGLYPTDFATAATTVATLVILMVLIWNSAQSLDRSERGRQAVEAALRESEEKWRRLFSILPVGVSVIDAHHRISDLNPALASILEISREGLLQGTHAQRQYLRSDNTPMELGDFPSVRAVQEQRVIEPIEVGVVKEDGVTIWTEVSAAPLTLPNAICVVTTTNITARKRDEEKLRQQEKLLRQILEILPVGVYLADCQGHIYQANQAGQAIWAGVRNVAPDGYGEYKGWWPETGAPIGAHEWALARAVEKGETSIDEIIEIEAFDGTRKMILNSGIPIRSEAHAITGALAVIQDITELWRTREALARKARELERSNAELQQFAYVTSHDLQEPLRTVASYVQLLQRRYRGQLDAKADQFIQMAVDGSSRMQQLINDLLSYSRVGTQAKPLVPTDCNQVLAVSLVNLQAALAENAALVTHDELPCVNGDEVQLIQLFQNLIGNALKFRGEGPTRVHVTWRPDGRDCLFSVSDNGLGIEPQYAERIFVIFQRLHSRSEYAGTGIGLAICKRIVERHGGRIWVDSALGQGATFCFTLPRAEGASDGNSTPPAH
jgi:PAS domain S-box-containing protein